MELLLLVSGWVGWGTVVVFGGGADGLGVGVGPRWVGERDPDRLLHLCGGHGHTDASGRSAARYALPLFVGPKGCPTLFFLVLFRGLC